MAITKLSSPGDLMGSQVGGMLAGTGSIAGPASYVSGGFAADVQTDFGLANAPDYVSVKTMDDSGRIAEYDLTNLKIKVYEAGGAEVTGATDLSSVTFRLLFVAQP